MNSKLTQQVAGSARIYIPPGSYESPGVKAEHYVHEYPMWHLVLQPENNRQLRGIAAGLLIAKRAVILATDLEPDEWADLAIAFKDGDAPRRLCEKVDEISDVKATFTGDFTGPAFNCGELAGQTQAQVHAHIYPVTQEEAPDPGVRNGMGAMVEALKYLQR